MPNDEVQNSLRECAWLSDPEWSDARAAGEKRFPRVISQLEDLTTLRLLLDIDADLEWFRGHFPDNPVLPGVVQLHWAIGVAQTCFGYLDTPNEILRLKFKSIVTPPKIVELALSRPRTGEVQFDYTGLGQQYSQGRLKFAVNTQ
jgi:ApeI dehydratase